MQQKYGILLLTEYKKFISEIANIIKIQTRLIIIPYELVGQKLKHFVISILCLIAVLPSTLWLFLLVSPVFAESFSIMENQENIVFIFVPGKWLTPYIQWTPDIIGRGQKISKLYYYYYSNIYCHFAFAPTYYIETFLAIVIIHPLNSNLKISSCVLFQPHLTLLTCPT